MKDEQNENGMAKTIIGHLIQDAEQNDEKLEWLVVMACEALPGNQVHVSIGSALGINNRFIAESRDNWLQIFQRIIGAYQKDPERLARIAMVGSEFSDMVDTMHVDDERVFWSMSLTSMRGENGSSKVLPVSICSNPVMATKFDAMTLAVVAFFRAMITGSNDAFASLTKMLLQEDREWQH